MFFFLPGNKTIVSDAKSITHFEIFPSKFKRHYDTVNNMTSKIKYLKSTLRTLICPFRFLFFYLLYVPQTNFSVMSGQ